MNGADPATPAVRSPRTHRRGTAARGFSLLEVILSLAILTGAIAVLGEVGRLGLRNAQIARDTTQAQLLCESKMAEITSGITMADSVPATPLENPVDENQINSPLGDGEVAWLYSITVDYTDVEGIVAVCVTVAQDLPLNKRPIEFSLVRWMPDPGLELSAESTEESSGSEDTGGSDE